MGVVVDLDAWREKKQRQRGLVFCGLAAVFFCGWLVMRK